MVGQFVQGLEKYKAGGWSPPKLPSNPVTSEGIHYARTMNAFHGNMLFRNFLENEESSNAALNDFDALLDLAHIPSPSEKESRSFGFPAITYQRKCSLGLE